MTKAVNPVSGAGFMLGLRKVSVLVPGVVVFGVAFGAAASAKGLSLAEALLMSALVYGGVSQLVAMEVWRPEWSWGAIVAVAVVTATVNSRMILQGASLQPWFASSPKWLNALHLFLFTDASWAIGTRYRGEGGRDIGVLIGAGFLLWVVWVAFTGLGHGLGALLSDPRRYGIDLVMPIFFAAMIVPLWRGPRAADAFIIAGSLSGALVGAFRHDAA